MKTWTIGGRITLLSASLLAIIAAGSIGAVITLLDIDRMADTIDAMAVPGLAVSADLKSVLSEGYVRTLLFGVAKDEAGRKKLLDDFDALAKRNGENLKAYASLARDSREMAALFAQFQEKREPYMEARAKYFEMVTRGDPKTGDFLENRLRPAYRAYTATGETLFQYHRQEAQTAAAAISAHSHKAVAAIAIDSTIAALAGVALAYVMSARIRRRLRDITEILESGSEQVAAASKQVEGTSQTLAAVEEAKRLKVALAALHDKAEVAAEGVKRLKAASIKYLSGAKEIRIAANELATTEEIKEWVARGCAHPAPEPIFAAKQASGMSWKQFSDSYKA